MDTIFLTPQGCGNSKGCRWVKFLSPGFSTSYCSCQRGAGTCQGRRRGSLQTGWASFFCELSPTRSTLGCTTEAGNDPTQGSWEQE